MLTFSVVLTKIINKIYNLKFVLKSNISIGQKQGTLTEGEGSVWLTSLRKLVS